MVSDEHEGDDRLNGKLQHDEPRDFQSVACELPANERKPQSEWGSGTGCGGHQFKEIADREATERV